MSGNATSFQSRNLVRAQPYKTQQTVIQQTVANLATVSFVFEISSVLCDRNQLHAGIINSLPSVGPYLDAFVLVDVGGCTWDVKCAADATGGFYTILAAPIALAAGTPAATIAGLRIPARYGQLLFTNLSGGNAVVDMGAYLGSV